MLTPGLLSTNYSGNYTLVDLKDALFDRILYLKMPQSAALLDMAMKKDMLKFNPQNFEECF